MLYIYSVVHDVVTPNSVNRKMDVCVTAAQVYTAIGRELYVYGFLPLKRHRIGFTPILKWDK